MVRIARTTLPLLVLAAACTPADDAPEAGPPEAVSPAAAPASGVVEVVARGLTFEAPDTVRPGWTTFRLRNESPMVHFALVERLPPGIGAAEQQAEVAPAFQEGMNLLAAGDADAAMEAFGALPEWYGDVVFLGGPGLTAAGRTSEATVYLESGTYLLECYVKTDGVFHSFNADPGTPGMVHEFVVAGLPSDAAEPGTSIALSLSDERGLEMVGVPEAGRNVVSVSFLDQTAHENFVGHDVHLARLEADTDMAALEAWMDWTLPGGLATPAPVEFLGGLNEMPQGTTGFFTVDLEPGDYAFLAEVPDADAKGMLVRFTVEPPTQ